MRRRFLVVLLLVCGLTSQSGCQRLNVNESYTLNPMEIKELTITAPAYEQRVRVTVTPSGGGVLAFLVKESDSGAANRYINANKEPPPSLILGKGGSLESADAYSFDATVPAKTDYSLILQVGSKRTDVKVSIVGR